MEPIDTCGSKLTVGELRKWLETFDPKDRIVAGLLDDQLVLGVRSRENADRIDAEREKDVTFPGNWQPDSWLGDVVVIPKN